MAMKIYTDSFAGILPDIFAAKTKFMRSFGSLQPITGAEASEDFMKLKVSDTEVVIQKYSTDANVGFGTGTGSSNRFGVRREVKSVDLQVPFDTPLAIHEGVDRFTVNDIADEVVAEKLAHHVNVWASHYDDVMSKTIEASASKTLTGELTVEGVSKVFSDAYKEFVNNEVSDTISWVAYVKADVYNLLIDSNLTTTLKNSSVDIDNQSITMFKGFEVVVVGDNKMTSDAYFVADNVGAAGIGVNVARAMDSEDFAGVVIQAAASLGKYIPEKNKKAILKATITPKV